MNASGRFAFVFDEELCESDIVAVVVTTPTARKVEIWAEVEIKRRAVILRQLAIYGVDVAPGGLGWPLLRRMAQAAMEEFDVDLIRIEATRRIAGARPGRAVPPIEFRRRPLPSRARGRTRRH